MQESEFNALLKLLSDPDEFVSGSARKKLISEFDNIQDKFTTAIAESENDFFVKKATEIVREYTFKNLQKDIKQWLKSDKQDILMGLLKISRLFDVEFNQEDTLNFFENLRRRLQFDISNLSPIEQIRVLNAILFKEYKFTVVPNTNEYQHYVLHLSVKNKKTSPLLMTIIYYLAAKKLQIPLHILKYNDIHLISYFVDNPDADVESFNLKKKIDHFFFVNPSDKGFIFTSENIKYSLHKHKINNIYDFQPVTSKNLLIMILNKLIFIARKNAETDLQDFLFKLQKILIKK
jgi:hypothetical protein